MFPFRVVDHLSFSIMLLLLLLLPPSLFSQISTLDVVAAVDKEAEQCDLFRGEWISDPSGPAYTNASCNYYKKRSPSWSCMDNEQRDKGYLHWRWRPYGCDLPPFDPIKFLNSMRHRSWGLIGDSLLRNQLFSLVCLLSKVEQPIELPHEDNVVKKKSFTWHFPSYNFTVENIFAPFLIKYTAQGEEADLDILESNWTTKYPTHDYIVFSPGSWFEFTRMILREKGKIIGCHNCGGFHDELPELGSDFPYRRALQTTFDFITASDHKPVVILRTWSPDHFENGEWNTGGFCNRTMPYRSSEYNGKHIDHVRLSIEREEFSKAVARGSERGIRIKLMDITHLSLLRPDGHPYIDRSHSREKMDCLHWCLPGPIDTWNQLMMAMLNNDGDLGLRQAYSGGGWSYVM